jgi:type I restriction enzyme M protein
MLDTETKRRIDTARDILVGKVPDPKSQVEQITIALIYKFMDDMDAEAEELGGKRKFFSGDFARYGWAKLMRAGLGGHETLNLYAEAITKMPENPGIPPLFRDIFKNAYLPYRDPETLKIFLKVIDEFTYDHSERLGDAFEYLLSVLGSQGDAGQFRTPRHIIDFIVAVVGPKKDETILDPACGTAGFLISSYKHIVAKNTNKKGQVALTPDDKGRIAQNLKGYDISPDMVRLSLVNLYLHGFTDPHIDEYDTLTSEDKWNEFADVVLANPPFMSPKGGIRPHKRFSVKSKRSEVLFVDYMAEHLTPSGRAGIIVPEGIIFQSQKAHKQLRQMLVDNSLVAVISLPAGVFNPYSGVKTSILILDKSLAKQSDTIGFFKVENDGFDLGAQRRAIETNDLPQASTEIGEYLDKLRARESVEDFQPALGLVVPKEKIAANGDYNLSGERYREGAAKSLNYPSHFLSDVCDIFNGSTPAKKEPRYWEEGTVPWFTIEDIRKNGRIIQRTEKFVTVTAMNETSLKLLPKHSVLLCCTASVGEYAFTEIKVTTNQQFNGLVVKEDFVERLLPKFLFFVSSRFKDELIRLSGKTAFNFVSVGTLKTIQIPLPPLEVQKDIVAEIEGYQKVIDGARAVVENYKPLIQIDPEWPMVALGEVCKINPDKLNPEALYPKQTIFYIDISSIENGTGRFLGYNEVNSAEAPSRARRGIQVNDVLLSTVRPNLKAFAILKDVCKRAVASTGFAILRANTEVVEPRFLFESVRSEYSVAQMVSMMGKGAYPSINQSDIVVIKIPLPPLDTQQQIVAEIEAEQALVDANRELIERFEKKIQATIARIWGEDDATSAKA